MFNRLINAWNAFWKSPEIMVIEGSIMSFQYSVERDGGDGNVRIILWTVVNAYSILTEIELSPFEYDFYKHHQNEFREMMIDRVTSKFKYSVFNKFFKTDEFKDIFKLEK